MNAKWIAYFFVIGIVVGAGECLADSNNGYDSSYTYSQSLYPDKEEANKKQFQQMQLENDFRMRAIKSQFQKQQFNKNRAAWPETALTKVGYQESFLSAETEDRKGDKDSGQEDSD